MAFDAEGSLISARMTFSAETAVRDYLPLDKLRSTDHVFTPAPIYNCMIPSSVYWRIGASTVLKSNVNE